MLAWVAGTLARGDSPWLYGIHWYGDPAAGQVELMTGGRGIWSMETVCTRSDVWWGAAWQRDYRFLAAVNRGHTLIVRIQPNWGENVPFAEHVAQYLLEVQSAAATLADVCHIWQVGNEPNLYGEWGGQELTAAAYVDLYRQIRAAIRGVASPLGPQIVLVGAVSPGGVEPGVRHTEGNVYLAQMCALLTAEDLDGFSIHAYAAPWLNGPQATAEFYAGVTSQLSVIEAAGFYDQPVYLTEWNRRVEPLNDWNEAQSADFVHGALVRLADWNARPGAHPVTCACWFIYAYDSGVWANYSIEYLRTVGPPGPSADLWDSYQAACALDLPATYPVPGSVPRLIPGTPAGENAALHAGVQTDSGDGTLAVDGIVSVPSQWTSAADTPDHWLTLDLGGVRTLTGIIVRHAGAAGQSTDFNTRTLDLSTAVEPEAWEVDALVYNSAASDVTELVYATPRPARFVRLHISDPGIDHRARIPELEVYRAGVAGDFDGDGDVDGADVLHFLFCLQGPGKTFPGGHACRAGDFDGDADVDLADLAGMQRAP